MSDPIHPQVPPTAPEPVPPGAHLPPGWAAAPPTSPPPPTQPVPAPAPPPSSRAGRIVLVAAAALAVAGGGAFALLALGSGGGGADTPEEAAEQLVGAVADEDVLGIADLLPDGERELLRDLATAAGDEYQRLGVLSDEFRLDGFRGLDITVDDPEFDIDTITDGDGDDDGLALASLVDGDLAVEVDGDEVAGNLGDVVDDVAGERDADLDIDDVEEEADAEESGVVFAVVEEDGRWHPSLFFTAAELLRRDSGGDEPDFDEALEPDGADSPEGVVQALVDAGVDLDAEAALALLDPGEARAAHVYSQFFLPADEADLGEGVEVEAELTDAEVDDLGGGVNRVVPTGFEARVTDEDGGEAVVTLDDGCVTFEADGFDEESEPIDEELCFAGDGGALPDEVGDVEVPDELREVAEAFLPLRFGIVTVERDGEHFLSPVRTLGDVVLGLTRGLEPDDLEEGGPIFALLSGELDDELETFFDDVFEELEFDFDEEIDGFGDDDEEDADAGDGEDVEPCEGVGCGFDEEPQDEEVERTPTGPSGANGELLVFDVVAGSVTEDAPAATFTAVADAAGDFVLGAQGFEDFDAVITVNDAATGAELATNDDFIGRDPEVLVTLAAGQVVTVQVTGFASDVGDFVVYFEPF